MKKLLSILVCLCIMPIGICQEASNQTQVIAHRGYWDTGGSAQNSIAALQKAQNIIIYGSELDVLVTSDSVPVVNHDDVIDGMRIEDTPYDQLKNLRLKNGEKLPTLKEYLKQGKKDPYTRLIVEIKPHSSKEKETRAVALIVDMVQKSGLEAQVDYISFSLHICRELRRLSADAPVYYLSGDLSPQEIKMYELTGMDYHFSVLQKNKHWVREAHALGLKVNTWTVNSVHVMREMVDLGVDFITTDKPYVAKQMIKSWNTCN